MPSEDKIPRILRNELFYAFARLCMVAAAVIGMPVATFLFGRVINTADEIRVQVQQQNTAILLLTSEVKFRFANVDDHEHRIRRLELGAVSPR